MEKIINGALSYVSIAGINDLIDILVVAFVIYKLISLLRDTAAERLLKGIALLFIIMQVVKVLQLSALSYILSYCFTYGAVALLVIFQPELRRVLEQLGKGHLQRFITGSEIDENAIEQAINQTVIACEAMSWTRTGVLMVFERQEKLGEIVNTGTTIDAAPSSELLKNIFYPKSPLHDGAAIMREGRICAAACVLPLSGNQNLSRDLGTRHRAAVGMSESSDAVVVVVSEETGTISVAIGGMLKRHLTPEMLRRILTAELIPSENANEKKKKRFFPERRNKGSIPERKGSAK